MEIAETSLDNLVLLVVFAGLVVATCLTGACTLMAKRWQVDAAPRMLPYLTVANSIVAVIGAYRWWGFALGSLVNMAVTVLLVLINRRVIASKMDKKADDQNPTCRGSDLDSIVVEVSINSNDKTIEASVRDLSSGDANRAVQAKSVVDMLREHQQKFGSNACNASDPAPFTGAAARQSILMSAFSPASQRVGFETHRRSKSVEKDLFPPVHSVTDDIVDSLMNGAVMEQLLSNGKRIQTCSC